MTKKELEDYFWGAANILRGMIGAADFKQYILIRSHALRSSLYTSLSQSRHTGMDTGIQCHGR